MFNKDCYKNKRIIVGNSSFIPSHFIRLLVSCGSEVALICNLSDGKKYNLQNISNLIIFEKKDLMNK
tara:strand:- start:117 stop:317 length:201 start_codon:yes stop_codon:yes gene_type:complete